MSYVIEFSQQTKKDLREIYNYIKENSDIQTAKKQIDNIEDKIYSLNNFPFRHPTYEIKNPKQINWNLHGMPINRYIVLYEINEEKEIVYIIRVIHGARDIEAQLLDIK